MMETLDYSRWWQPALAALVAVAIALVVHAVGRRIVLRLGRFSPMLRNIARHVDRPARLVLPLLALQAVWQAAPDALPLIGAVRQANVLLLVAALTWLAIEAVRGVADAIVERHPTDVVDNLQARRIGTQTRVLSRIVTSTLALAGLAFALMTIPGARQLGTSLLASAGVVGIVAGIAARPVFSNLIAGLQIALAQPIRIDDVLIVEGEWGRVEEITGTYVVLKIWDERRLVIPLQWFVEHPFQNWTRSSAELLGTVFLWVDYTLPLEPLRAEAERVCKASAKWDGRVCQIVVVDASERAMQLRVLVSAASSGAAWDLRCELREALIRFIEQGWPEALPKLRAELGGAAASDAPERAPG